MNAIELWRDVGAVERWTRSFIVSGECWLWTGAYKKSGHAYYGQFQYSRGGVRKRYRAHVLGWEIHNQRGFPKDLIARHTCDDPKCVNPAHIVPGTKADNTRDMIERGRHGYLRRSHCKHGHPLTGDNMRWEGTWRRCRECVRTRSRKHYHQKKEAIA